MAASDTLPSARIVALVPTSARTVGFAVALDWEPAKSSSPTLVPRVLASASGSSVAETSTLPVTWTSAASDTPARTVGSTVAVESFFVCAYTPPLTACEVARASSTEDAVTVSKVAPGWPKVPRLPPNVTLVDPDPVADDVLRPSPMKPPSLPPATATPLVTEAPTSCTACLALSATPVSTQTCIVGCSVAVADEPLSPYSTPPDEACALAFAPLPFATVPEESAL